MIQRGGGARFLLEPRKPFGVGGERLGQDLDGHIPAEPGVARLVDLAHPAGAERRRDFIGAEASAGCQGQWSAVSIQCRSP